MHCVEIERVVRESRESKGKERVGRGREFGASDDGCLYQPPRANAAGRTSTFGESGVINPRQSQSQFQTNHAQSSYSTNEQTGNVICDVYLATDQTQPLKSGHSSSKLNQECFV
jgi:hypothetical protein